MNLVILSEVCRGFAANPVKGPAVEKGSSDPTTVSNVVKDPP